jgi:hypothetical protein
LRSLFKVAGRLPPWSPEVLLLHRQIPHISRIPTMRQQSMLLLRSRRQSIPRHSRTVTSTTDTPDHITPIAPRRSAESNLRTDR